MAPESGSSVIPDSEKIAHVKCKIYRFAEDENNMQKLYSMIEFQRVFVKYRIPIVLLYI